MAAPLREFGKLDDLLRDLPPRRYLPGEEAEREHVEGDVRDPRALLPLRHQRHERRRHRPRDDDAGAGAVTGEQVAGALEKLDPFGGGAYGDLKALPLITVAAEMVKAASSGSELEFGGFIMKFRGVNDDGS